MQYQLHTGRGENGPGKVSIVEIRAKKRKYQNTKPERGRDFPMRKLIHLHQNIPSHLR
jgi:hypothetical protein